MEGVLSRLVYFRVNPMFIPDRIVVIVIRNTASWPGYFCSISIKFISLIVLTSFSNYLVINR